MLNVKSIKYIIYRFLDFENRKKITKKYPFTECIYHAALMKHP